jgi:HlyD family secretion protein
MLKGDSTLNVLIVAAVLALGVGYYVPKTFSSRPAVADKPGAVNTNTNGTVSTISTGSTPAPPATKTAATKSGWAASAPGRVEPAGGEVRIGSQAAGRIAEVLVALNDKVGTGEILVRLDDGDLVARVHAATADVAVRRRDRDGNESTGRLAQDRRNAEDNVASAERQLVLTREELDRLVRLRRSGTAANQADFDKARDAVAKSQERLETARLALRKALSVDNLPAPTRQEAALTAGRAELSLAEAALERTRIRAPSAGTALQISARVGETATPSPENVLLTLGNLESLQVKAELEERDVGKARLGQLAVMRSDAFPGKDFEGKVTSLARALGPSRLGQRGPRKPTDVDVLEVVIELSGQTPLLPGMRVDVFLKNDNAAASTPSGGLAKAN